MNYGRNKIYTDEEKITVANIRDVLRKAYVEHVANSNTVSTRWDYYRGKTAIAKDQRDELKLSNVN